MILSTLSLAWSLTMVMGDSVCDIAEGELQPNGEPCAASCCRRKGSCLFNFDTKECLESPGDQCLKNDKGLVCLAPCCDTKPPEMDCEFNGIVRQCMKKGALDPCRIKPGFLLPNGRPCRQECCIRRNKENGGPGCIWNHTKETCTQPRPVDPCVDEAPGLPCLGPCCKSKSECNWDPHARQCLTKVGPYSWLNRMKYLMKYAYDTNKNGYLDAKDAMWDTAKVADVNEDSKVDEDEFIMASQAYIGVAFDDYPAEIIAFLQGMFNGADTDGDSELSLEEFKAFHSTGMLAFTEDEVTAAYGKLTEDGPLTYDNAKALYQEFASVTTIENGVYFFGPLVVID